MTREEFAEHGEAVFGRGWQSALARHFSINSRTVRKYVAGDLPVPDWLAAELLHLRHGQFVDDNLAAQLGEMCDAIAAADPSVSEGEYPEWIAIRFGDLVYLCNYGEVTGVAIWDREHERIVRPRLIIADEDLRQLTESMRTLDG